MDRKSKVNLPSAEFLKRTAEGNSDSFVLGIDPGLGGGLAFQSIKFPSSVHVFPMPTKVVSKNKRAVDVQELNRLLAKFRVALVVVERVHSHPKQGVASVFSFGLNCGRVLGLVESKELPLEQPLPQRWKNEVLRDTKKDKEAAVHWVKNRFPYLSLLATERSKKPHDGMADAICLAEFGRRILVGSG